MRLDGSQENPPVTTASTGTGWAVLNTDMTRLKYQVTYARLQSAFAASHFHVGVRGINGPVVQPITFQGNTASGEWTNLHDSIVVHLLKGNVYTNVHSSGNPGGEIRGQLEGLFNGAGFSANLDGAQEVPPVSTTARGTGFALYQRPEGSAGDTIDYRITIAGLSAAFTASHFHSGPVGVAGPVVQPITFVDSTGVGSWGGFADSIVANIAKGGLYFNVHSGAFPGGEIRGQLLLGSGTITAVEQIGDAYPVAYHLSQNYPNPFNPSTSIDFAIPSRSQVILKVYNLLGQEVASLVDELKDAGSYRVRFDAEALSAGVYFYRLSADRFSITRKMILLK